MFFLLNVSQIITIKRTKDLNYFSLCAFHLFNTRVSQFELNYWNKWTFPQHSNLLRCTCKINKKIYIFLNSFGGWLCHQRALWSQETFSFSPLHLFLCRPINFLGQSVLLLVNSTSSLLLQCFQGQRVIDSETVADVEQFQCVCICMCSIDRMRGKCALSVMWKDINIVCLMAYVDLVEHTHSALEVPLKMTKTESLIS